MIVSQIPVAATIPLRSATRRHRKLNSLWSKRKKPRRGHPPTGLSWPIAFPPDKQERHNNNGSDHGIPLHDGMLMSPTPHVKSSASGGPFGSPVNGNHYTLLYPWGIFNQRVPHPNERPTPARPAAASRSLSGQSPTAWHSPKQWQPDWQPPPRSRYPPA